MTPAVSNATTRDHVLRWSSALSGPNTWRAHQVDERVRLEGLVRLGAADPVYVVAMAAVYTREVPWSTELRLARLVRVSEDVWRIPAWHWHRRWPVPAGTTFVLLGAPTAWPVARPSSFPPELS